MKTFISQLKAQFPLYEAAIALILVAFAIGYPLLNEGSSNVCSALEMRLITLESRKSGNQAATAFLAALQGSLSNGRFAMSIVKQQHPNLPPIAGCTLAYWQTIFNPPGEEKRTVQDDAQQILDAQRALERAKEAQKAMRALSSPVAPLPAKPGQQPN